MTPIGKLMQYMIVKRKSGLCCILTHVLLNLEKCVDPDHWLLKKPTDQDPHSLANSM